MAIHLEKWEARNWTDSHHGNLFKCITAWLRWRPGKTKLKWVKGHSGIKGNEEADKLTGEGASKPIPPTLTPLDRPPNLTTNGATLAHLEQKDLYRILISKNKIPKRSKTEQNIKEIKTCAQDTFKNLPSTEAIWLATKNQALTKKMRDFIWKATQNMYKIGEFWLPISSFEERGICPLCDELDSMEHILTKCSSNVRSTAWRLANDLWRKKSNTDIPMKLGDILGCGLAKFETNSKTNKGINRLYTIIISETTYLIWKMRNERRIRDRDNITETRCPGSDFGLASIPSHQSPLIPTLHSFPISHISVT